MKDSAQRLPPARSRFRPYPAYKDSGVAWLGDLPAHWRALALKRIGDLQAGAGFPDDEQGIQDEELPFFKVGDMGAPGNEREMLVHQHSVSRATARRLRAHVFQAGTIVFAKVGAALLLNRRRLLARPSCIDNNMMGFVPDDCDTTWALYWLTGLDMGRLANPGAVPSVNEGQMRDTPAAVPPLPEQRAIAAFLDRETVRIDALVAKKERLIELLQEKRTALITRAVTKGLDPTVPMKDSGVEWLGEIPAGWVAIPLKRAVDPARPVTYGIVQCGPDYPDGIPYIRPVDMTDEGGVQVDSLQHTTPEIAAAYARSTVRPGDIVVSIGPSFGKAMIVPRELDGANLTQGTARVAPSRDVFARFLFWALRSDSSRMAWDSFCSGATFRALTLEILETCEVVLPAPAEQRAIAGFLDRETTRVDVLVAKVRDAIDRLKELRTALISAAVTGKIDMREEVA